MLRIEDRIETAKLNGYRQPGELYLVGDLPTFQCCNLPRELSKHLAPKRGILPVPPTRPAFNLMNCPPREGCPIYQLNKDAVFMWVKEKHYSHAAMFFAEARTRAIQMRIKRVPAGLVIGKTWVLLGHRKAIIDYSEGAQGWIDKDGNAQTNIKHIPGIFAMFQVQAIEYVVDDLSESYAEKMAACELLAAAGITLVDVIKDVDLATQEYPESEDTNG